MKGLPVLGLLLAVHSDKRTSLRVELCEVFSVELVANYDGRDKQEKQPLA